MIRFGWILAAILLSSALPATTSPAATQPNILLILTDDQGWPTIGCYGGKIVPTPNLDRLALEGVQFTSAYVTSQCTPTRASLLTGQYTARNGLWHVLSGYWYPHARMSEMPFAVNLPRETPTLAKGLRAAGYRTAIVGKWHLTTNGDGNYQGLRPEAASHYGFDYAPPVLSRSAFRPGYDRGVDLLTEQALGFIEENRDRPWFCYVSHHMIHGVVVAPTALEDKYREWGYGDTGPNRAVYLAGLEHLDRSVGTIMNRLDSLGETDETLILFLSDNGGIHKRLGFRSLSPDDLPLPRFQPDLVEYDNAPLRGGKGSIYEGGVRVPFIARWPGTIRPGFVCKTPVHVVDILPTCLAAAGAPRLKGHTLDGRNLLPLMTSESDRRLTRRPLYQYMPFYDLAFSITPSASIHLGRYKLIEFFGDRVASNGQYTPGHHLELYDLATDTGEKKNLLNTQPEIADMLHKQLHRWMRRMGVPQPGPNPRFDPLKAFTVTREKPAWLLGAARESQQQ